MGGDHGRNPGRDRPYPGRSVLGVDKKPLKTRSGENVTLASLIDEAIGRGCTEVRRRAEDEKAPTHGFSDEELDRIGAGVGIGAIKYADLSNDLVRDYVFDMDRMIAFEGDTGPYLQYAHARICSIIAKAEDADETIGSAELRLDEPAERALALHAPVRTVIAEAGLHLEPHRICTELHALAEAFNGFYQQCPVRKAASDELRRSRLRLYDLSRRVLADGLDLLGIEAIQQCDPIGRRITLRSGPEGGSVAGDVDHGQRQAREIEGVRSGSNPG